ncbi:TIGR04282 family arsenosugar biosynthesis glycosyltransferase [Amphritea sp. HPY]|uniref:TIGR04282 family arsenosugar biosynthesis glycosyltransferase n=1 Tax=Amphritea sp. HPY TaxID=3421652 RepID=UPI003D7E861E
MNQLPTLVIFCKRPLPGQGKQRIAATMGKAAAFEIATALLKCALEDAEVWPGNVVLSPASVGDKLWAESLLQREHRVVPQCEGNLGVKLSFIDQDLRQQGDSSLLFIGTDAPEHTVSHYKELINLFSEADMLFSPAADGGVTAMGCNQPWPELSGLPWSTPQLGTELVASCQSAGFQVAFSSACYDVDTAADLERLKVSLKNDTRPARQQLLQRIESLLD